MMPFDPNTQVHHSSQVNPPAAPPSGSIPPVRGKLPYTREAYEKLPAFDKTAELDFLILGKIPSKDYRGMGGRASPADRVIAECVKRGETDALKFLWDQWGVDPNSDQIGTFISELDLPTAQTFVSLCHDYAGLQLNLHLSAVTPQAATELSGLITQGKVRILSLEHELGSEPIDSASLTTLSSVCGNVSELLKLIGVTFNADAEQALANSLAHSTNLKRLVLVDVDFQGANGDLFVDAMKSNRSIADLSVFKSPIPTSQTTGFAAILANNNTIENLDIYYKESADSEMNPEIEAVLVGAAGNKTLRSLTIERFANHGVLTDPSGLHRLLENNSTLTKLKVDITLASRNDYLALADSLKKNTSLISFVLSPPRPDSIYTYLSFDETIIRNKALAKEEMLRAAGMIFDSPSTAGFSDIGSLIARNVLANSSSVAEFSETMAAVDLSIREMTKRMSEVSSSAAPSITTTTDSVASTTTTTTTTTSTNSTNQSSPGSPTS